MYASNQGHVETVLEMVPYAKPEDLERSICWAAKRGHLPLVTMLLEKGGVSPNTVSAVIWGHMGGPSEGGETLLMLATAALDPKMVKILLVRGADVHKTTSRDLDFETSFMRRRGKRHENKPESLTALHSLASRNLTPDNENAAQEILNMLLSAGANIEAKDGSGNTPLLLTIGSSRISASDPMINLKLFLAAGADPCAMDTDGESLLHRACKSLTTTEVAELLLSYKANPIQARASDGATPVHS